MMEKLGKNQIRDNFWEMLIELIDNKYLTKAKEITLSNDNDGIAYYLENIK